MTSFCSRSMLMTQGPQLAVSRCKRVECSTRMVPSTCHRPAPGVKACTSPIGLWYAKGPRGGGGDGVWWYGAGGGGEKKFGVPV